MSVLPAVAAAGSAGATADNLGEGRGGYDALVALRGEIADELHGEVAAMNLDKFIVRPQGEHVGRFRERKAWDGIDEGSLTDLREHIAGRAREPEHEQHTATLCD